MNGSFAFYINPDPTDIKHPSFLSLGWYNLSLIGQEATWHYINLTEGADDERDYWILDLKEIVLQDSFENSNILATYCNLEE